ncbi:sigma-54-dependent transcriptional regulator [Xanthovirga aplysinae]|uniref:sigma-54-dependent transcriptional regulator n=1 Tax=Xanthovirga aplysinae TaxID=2529853 RepID=UPI0012BCBA5F|nr:sigma-54 dependent transcriptional regulator [Xanthovirga aplysinae]MTI33116.1 sigma-54-dependent Fis family transcriptional regulator [Xanthovirga aplysinae]
MKKGNILIVDDNKSVLSALELLLQFEFDVVRCISHPKQIASELRSSEIDVVLLDMNFSAGLNNGNEGLFWLKEIKKLSPDTEVVLMTAFAEVELAVNALKLGAADFIVKPWQNEKLIATLQTVIKLRHSNQQIGELKNRENGLKQELYNPNDFLDTFSPAMQKVMQMVSKVAGTNASVLITGENGTGKELIAREIHRQSQRNKKGLLVTVDMGALSENLVESELFGHKKGAFTDAKEDRMGKFQLADKGTLFLDEIGNLSLQHQAKLLVALESRNIVPLGSNKNIKVDIRLISATNNEIEKEVENGQFREDLLYRLNTIRIELPPLRERGEDIELLAGFFVKKYQKKYQKKSLRLSSGAIRKLMQHHWPGNVRELKHTIEKAVILSDQEVLKAEDFIFKPIGGKKAHQRQATLADMERQMIEEAMDKYNGNLSLVAEKLGISRQTLYNKMKRYAI